MVATWKMTSTWSPSRRLVPVPSAVRSDTHWAPQSGEHVWAICTSARVTPAMVPAIAASTASSTVAPGGSVGNLVGDVLGEEDGDLLGEGDGDALGDVDGLLVGAEVHPSAPGGAPFPEVHWLHDACVAAPWNQLDGHDLHSLFP